MEKLLEDISFAASDTPGKEIEIDAAYVREHVGVLAKNADLSRFVPVRLSRCNRPRSGRPDRPVR